MLHDVALTVYGNQSSADRYIVRFTDDGIAELDGRFQGQDGHYVAPVAFDKVAAIVTAGDLCSLAGAPNLVMATPSAQPSAPPDFLLRIHCGERSKSFRPSSEPGTNAAAKLTALVVKQTWRRNGASQIDQRILLGQ